MLLRTAGEKYYSRRLDSINNDVKRNWKVLNRPMGKIKKKKSFRKECIADVDSKNYTTKICDAFCNYFIDHTRIHRGSISVSTSQHLHQKEINEIAMYFRHVSETDIIESLMHLNKVGGINYVSRKFLVIYKSYVSYYLKDWFNFSCTSGAFPNALRMRKLHPFIRKASFITYQNTRPVSVLSNLSVVFENLTFNRIQTFCQLSIYFAKKQFLFRKKRKTELAALNLLGKILPALEEKNLRCVFFLITLLASTHCLARSLTMN